VSNIKFLYFLKRLYQSVQIRVSKRDNGLNVSGSFSQTRSNLRRCRHFRHSIWSMRVLLTNINGIHACGLSLHLVVRNFTISGHVATGYFVHSGKSKCSDPYIMCKNVAITVHRMSNAPVFSYECKLMLRVEHVILDYTSPTKTLFVNP